MDSRDSDRGDERNTRPRWWHSLWLYLGAIAGALTVLIRLSDPVRQWLPAGLDVWLPLAFLLFAGLGAILLRNDGNVARAIYRALQHFSPLGTVLTLLLIILLLFQFRLQFRARGPMPVNVVMDPTRGALFNSWALPPGTPAVIPRKIRARGSTSPGRELMWVFDGDSARFTFEVDQHIDGKDPDASSGGYMTFYDTPSNRTDYNHLSFDSRVTDTAPGCQPDFGVRLAVDGQGRELATYELGSVVGYFKGQRKPDGNWQRFDIYVPDLTQVRVSTGPTLGIDQNTLNKIAFFINEATARHCNKATVWLKSVTLRP